MGTENPDSKFSVTQKTESEQSKGLFHTQHWYFLPLSCSLGYLSVNQNGSFQFKDKCSDEEDR